MGAGHVNVGHNFRSRFLFGRESRMEKRTLKPRQAMKESVPPRQMGSIAKSNGPYFEPISVLFHDKSLAELIA